MYEFLRARSLEEEGELREAKSAYERAIVFDPDSSDLRLEFARFLRNLGYGDESLKQAEVAAALDPSDGRAFRFLGETRTLGAKGDEALAVRSVKDFEKGKVLTEGRDSEIAFYADALLTLGNFEGAAEAYGVLLGLGNPVPPEVRLKAAGAFLRVGREEDGVAIYRGLLKDNPGDSRAAFELAGIFEQQGNYEEALSFLRPLSDQRPENLVLRAQVGYVLLRFRKFDEAFKLLEAVLETDPRNRPAREYLANGYATFGRFDDAERLFDELLADTPKDREVGYQRALNLSAAGKTDRARLVWAGLRADLEKEKASGDLWRAVVFQQALLEWNRGRGEDALELLRPVIERSPGAGALNLALEILRVRKQTAAALEIIDRARALDPGSVDLRIRQAQFLWLAGRRDAAESLACELDRFGSRGDLLAEIELWQRLQLHARAALVSEEAAGRFPDDLDFLFRLGSNSERAGDHRRAEQAFRKILAKSPDHGPTLNYLGYMFADANEKLHEAEEMILRAISRDPANAAYLDSLGWVRYRLKKYELAKKDLFRAAELAPEDWNIQEHVGDLLNAMGRKADAIEAWRRALALSAESPDPDDSKIEVLRAKLASPDRR